MLLLVILVMLQRWGKLIINIMKTFKKVSLILFILLANFCICYSQIRFSTLKPDYRLTEKLTFELFNTSPKKVYCIIGLEFYKGGNWRPLINDVENPESKSNLVSIILPKAKIHKSLSLKKLLYDRAFETFDKYRFKVSYGYSLNIMKVDCYSESFKIRP